MTDKRPEYAQAMLAEVGLGRVIAAVTFMMQHRAGLEGKAAYTTEEIEKFVSSLDFEGLKLLRQVAEELEEEKVALH
jgi:hypothetical protein